MTPDEGVLRQLLQQQAIVDVVTTLEGASVPAMLIKGEATFAALYAPDELRPTSDIDLLVPAARRSEADAALSAAGWQQAMPGLYPGESARHSVNWWKLVGGLKVALDLHTTFHGVTVHPQVAWDLWWDQAVPLAIGRRTVPAPSLATTALLVAVHRTRARPTSSAAEDLRRAIAYFSPDVWRDAAEQARTLGCEVTMAAGLETDQSGGPVIDRLQLLHPDWRERLAHRGQNNLALELAELTELADWGARLRRVGRAVAPSRGWLAHRHPYAARGGGWVVLARVHRVVDVLGRSPAAVASILIARRRHSRARR